MVDFAAHLPFTPIGYLKMLSKSFIYQLFARYFHLDRISDFSSIHRLSSHMLQAAEKRFRGRKKLLWDKFKIRTLKKYRFLSKIKLHPPIETVRSLNFRASTPTLYVKNKMAEASLLPQKEGKKILSRP